MEGTGRPRVGQRWYTVEVHRSEGAYLELGQRICSLVAEFCSIEMETVRRWEYTNHWKMHPGRVSVDGNRSAD